jgi:protein gp37
MSEAAQLALDQPNDLERHEARIEAAERNGYLVRGHELAAIRDGKLYRLASNHATFEEYCEQRWELDTGNATRLINAADFAGKAANWQLSMPARESHIRPLLSRLEADDDRIVVWRDVLATTNGARIKAGDVDAAITRFLALRDREYVTLTEWHEIEPASRAALLGRVGKSGLNKQDNADIEWADWSWNPVTGCLHGCPYCYARDIAANIYPEAVGFGAAIWPGRLSGPANQRVPTKAGQGIAATNIFTCSMADLFGRWVPDEWIEKVLATAAAHPKWNFLFLTKFPKRMSEFEIPANAWMGTTVDVQARVANAEKAFEKVKAAVRWLSIEPMLEPLRFKRLDLFEWVVIGGASPSKAIDGTPATPEWNVPIAWLADLDQQVRAAGCKRYYKTNSGLTGSTRLREYPGSVELSTKAPAVFDYLRALPRNEQLG